ncbi:glycosyltransferase [Pontibacter sp. HSC-36F09]|uniref:glycosyltransferase n=1 Tax=Pontibacter sp. HSC-36F09 TaxID=2910966 RepID=UPI0020A0B46A|nr:glycosyltransferase [Pontibacter sp. HSC-36F09]MCP2045722.1 glycosyltransferase involved in cell wall biosynthesis [Pontibacter sp. HSC-36F09]
MKILHVIASMNPVQGGPCQGVRNYIPELQKHGVYNEVVCLDKPQDFFLKSDGFKIQALGPGKSPWCYSAKLLPWLLNNLTRFDSVIVHGLWLYHGYAVKKAVEMLKRRHKAEGFPCELPKVFVMPHGMLDPYFQLAKERKLKAIRNWFYWKLIERRIINEANGALFTCEAELLLARKPFRPYKPQQESCIGFGIAEPPEFNHKMYGAFHQKCPQVVGNTYILFLSRIHEKKGVDMLLRAYERVLEARSSLMQVESHDGESSGDCLDNSCFPKLVIAGPGLETPYGQHIQRMVSQSPKLRQSVFFPGMLTGDAKWGAFYGCEAFVLPSHQENFGIAIVEALACSKPVLISNQVNIWREIKASGGGMVAEDTMAQTQQILEKWDSLSFSEKAEVGLRARRAYEEHFAVEPAAIKLLCAVR